MNCFEARPLASIAMLHIDIRASIDICSIADPQNSMTWPVPPAYPGCVWVCMPNSGVYSKREFRFK